MLAIESKKEVKRCGNAVKGFGTRSLEHRICATSHLSNRCYSRFHLLYALASIKKSISSPQPASPILSTYPSSPSPTIPHPSTLPPFPHPSPHSPHPIPPNAFRPVQTPSHPIPSISSLNDAPSALARPSPIRPAKKHPSFPETRVSEQEHHRCRRPGLATGTRACRCRCAGRKVVLLKSVNQRGGGVGITQQFGWLRICDGVWLRCVS